MAKPKSKPKSKGVPHPALCVCVVCEERRQAALPVIKNVDPALADRGNGHPVNCVCVDCCAGVTAAANTRATSSPGDGVFERSEDKWRL